MVKIWTEEDIARGYREMAEINLQIAHDFEGSEPEGERDLPTDD